ncbi:hypothetical protein NEFER03_0405 [Nematocida sp. LUAm3]|nr:hypothetical protein NEFER03_0405 [Nematocida sp. LUAm3]KAI5175979.1 hypothetical protein NEFER02_1825 [Nematocida sp. LUAm2]KAI5179075.1 hypothetical protein NEFER01_1942 [Nematocida sp. LUAm1]
MQEVMEEIEAVHPIPSFILRKSLKNKDLSKISGVKRVKLSGKIIRRIHRTFELYDTFCGISILCGAFQKEVNKSIKENYLVEIECILSNYSLVLVSIRRISFPQDIYNTLESMDFWIFWLQKQPK